MIKTDVLQFKIFIENLKGYAVDIFIRSLAYSMNENAVAS